MTVQWLYSLAGLVTISFRHILISATTKEHSNLRRVAAAEDCRDAVPYIFLESSKLLTNLKNIRNNVWATTQVSSSELDQDALASITVQTGTPLTAPNFFKIMIADIVAPNVVNDKDVTGMGPQLCYLGEPVEAYTNIACPAERGPTPRKHYFNPRSNGYEIRLVKTNRDVIMDAQIVDNQDGTYEASVRSDGMVPGEYMVEVYRNGIHGCHLADCDNPFCRGTDNSLKKPEDCDRYGTNCVLFMKSKKLIVEPAAVSTGKLEGQYALDRAHNLPTCDINYAGTLPGRWVNASYYLKKYSSLPIFKEVAWPLIWQPYDCSINWFEDYSVIEQCVKSDDFIFMGMSRERTNFFDMFDLINKKIDHSKLTNSKNLDNIYFVSYHFSHNKDAGVWNRYEKVADRHANMATIPLLLTERLFSSELGKNPSCRKDSEKKVYIMFTDESVILVKDAFRSKWKYIIENLFKHLYRHCPDATVVFKTAMGVSAQSHALTSQRLYEISRIGIEVAQTYNIKIIDAFSMTQMLSYDPDVFVDGLNIFTSRGSHVGNFVSKTVTMLFLKQICSSD